jgi:hypothetical protein
MLAFRTVQQSNHCAREDFLYILKAGPAGGLRPPSGPGNDTTVTGSDVAFWSPHHSRHESFSRPHLPER